MNKPFPSQREVNFAAVKFAIQYYSKEEQLAYGFKNGRLPDGGKDISTAQVVHDWVAHFNVARNFDGFGKLAVDERWDAYKKIGEHIRDYGPRGDESIADRAIRVGRELRALLGIKSSLLSATTKLLWLVGRESIIYDGNLRRALGTQEGDYRTFCDKWESEFRTMASAVEAAVDGLNDAAHLFPESWDLRHDTRRTWFMARTFDTFYWMETR